MAIRQFNIIARFASEIQGLIKEIRKQSKYETLRQEYVVLLTNRMLHEHTLVKSHRIIILSTHELTRIGNVNMLMILR